MMTDTQIQTTRTVAEIEAELKAARDAEAVQKQVREKQLQRARQQEELALTNGYMESLRGALAAQGVESVVIEGQLPTGTMWSLRYAILAFPEGSDGFHASAVPRLERRGDSNYQIQFGGYGERKTYPRLKDGSFKYDKIASELAAYIKYKTAEREREEQRQQAYKISCTLEVQLEKEFPDCGIYIRATNQPDAVMIKFERALNVEQARLMLITIQGVLAKGNS